MLLKYTQYQKRNRLTASGKPQRSTGTVKGFNGKGKGHRKGMKGAASKRLNQKGIATKREEIPAPVTTVDPCDNSNDSGLGFDHHLEFPVPRTQSNFVEHDYVWSGEGEAKRQRLEIKVESDNANDNFTFPQARLPTHTTSISPICSRGGKNVSVGKGGKRGNQCVTSQSVGLSRDGKVQLQILSQPETQHRARYQTEGSRGAVKDRTGNGFPIVKLSGYKKSAILEVYIGTDQGRVAPHMFYQACRVSGKNSTPCVEKKVDGTVLIEIELEPSKDMIATCDCVGILKERNVDVEHRFPEESSGRSKKKSTRCRMVFRTVITNDDNTTETLQVTSQPIICTQPPGVPEICKKSLSSCPAPGGLEMFILGKNFLKDTRVVFSEGEIGTEGSWEVLVHPDKEFLQQSHLVCVIPPYRREDIKEPVLVKLQVVSSGRSSEGHTFIYTPLGTSPLQAIAQEPSMPTRAIAQSLPSQPVFPSQNLLLGVPFMLPANKFPVTTPFLSEDPAIPNKCKEDKGSGTSSVVLMPPPSVVPVSVRRSSQTIMLPENLDLKRETETPPTEPVQVTVTPDLTESCQPSMATLREFVSTPNTPLPALSVETYFSKIEAKPLTANTTSGVSQPSLLVQKQERNDDGIVRDLLRSQALQEEITASMIVQTDVHETAKLDAFVNSTVDGHIDSARRSSSESEVSIPQVPMQTSPLNLNTHESISLTSPVAIEHILPLQQQIASPLQQQIASPLQQQITSPLQPQITSPLQQQITSPLQQQITSPIITNSIVTDAILSPATFSPGKDIRNVSDAISIAPVTTATFTEINASNAPSSTEMIMKAVNDAQFSPAQELVITSTIKDVLNSQGQPPLQSGAVIRPEEFISPGRQITQTEQIMEKAEPAAITASRYQSGLIINPVFSISDQTVPSSGETKSKPPVTAETSFQTNLVLENGHFSPPGESTDNLAARISTTFPQNIVFQPNRDLPVTTSQTNVTTFAPDVVAEVKSQFSTSTFSATTENNNIINGKISDTFSAPTKSEQGQENATIVSLTNTSQFITTVAGNGTTNGELKVARDVTQGQESKQYGPEVPRCTSEIQKQVAPQVDELARMSEHDLLSYINPSCFDQV